METIFKNPKLKSQNGRNAFDRSQHRVWHSPFGALLPCFCKRVNPDDYVELSVESQTICDKIIRPAFIRLKEHINWYFVPANMLWMPFDNFITGQDNYFSRSAETVQESSVPNMVPMFNSQMLAVVMSTLYSQVDVNGYSSLEGSLRLLDLLGYGNYYPLYLSQTAGGALDVSNVTAALGAIEPMNFFALLAYQKVYYDYYRNPKYEENQTKAYNIDDIKGGTIVNGTDVANNGRFMDIFRMHYAWAKKDYFTDVQPSILPTSTSIGFTSLNTYGPAGQTGSSVFSIFGLPGTSSRSTVAYVTNAQSADNNIQNNGERVSIYGFSDVGQGSGSVTHTSVQTNVAALRFAFAYDKLLRRMREAGGTFDAQMLAQFGIVPYDQRHGKCIYLGGQTNRLMCSDVTNTATDLGFLGGQLNCYSPARTTAKYHVKDHGFIIGVYNTSLDFDYPSYGIERDNLAKYRFDWFNPAFENLGLQPTFRMELLTCYQGDSSDNYEWSVDEMQNDPALRDIIGYSIRYQEYKTSIDRVYGLYDFGSGDSDRQAWVSQYYPFAHRVDSPSQYKGKTVAPFTKANMVLNPMMFDQLLQVNDDSGWITDPFNHNMYVHFKCISNMSSLGEVF